LVVRLWNVYGPEKDEEKSHVITDFCKMAKHDGIIKMRTDGMESRQFLYAEDCAECFLTLTTQFDKLDKKRNYHITNFEWVSILDIANILKSISGCDIVPGTRKDETQKNAMNEPDPYILNFWKPKTLLEEGIKKIYNEI
jgi:nucleoside-diphosphate-sugar epimerase